MTFAQKRLSVVAIATTLVLALALGGLAGGFAPEQAFADEPAADQAAAKTYTIKYKGVSGAKNTNPTQVEKGKLKLKKPSKTGYTFKGWYQGKKKVTTVNVKKNLTLTAKWKAKTYKITYKNVKGTNKNAKKFTYGKSVKLKKLSKSGYTFMGWYSDKYFTSKKLSKVGGKTAKNVTVYARWVKAPRTAREKKLVHMANLAYDSLSDDQYTTENRMVNALKSAGATSKEAKFVAKNCKANYYAQAVKLVSYAKTSPYFAGYEGSALREYVRGVMLDDGFTKKQVDYAFKVTKF